MRLVQILQVVLVAMLALLASCEAAAVTTKKEIATSAATSFVTSVRSLLALDDGLTSSEEERVSNAATAAAEGGRAGAGATGTVSSTGTSGGGGTITVTKYWNNGLLQKFERLLNKIFHRKTASKSTTRRLRQLTEK